MLKLYTQAQSGIVALRRKLRKFTKDESGATMVEYSVLIGLLTAAVIATVVLVGGWIEGQWDALWTALDGEGAT